MDNKPSTSSTNQNPSNLNPPHTLQSPSHTHQVPPHTHQGPPHAHQGPPHTHQGPSHTHLGPPHTHQGPPHTNQGPPHTHQGPSHTHQGPPHTHQGPSHTHQGPPHTHQGPSHMHQGPPHTHQGPPHTHQGPAYQNPPYSYQNPQYPYQNHQYAYQNPPFSYQNCPYTYQNPYPHPYSYQNPPYSHQAPIYSHQNFPYTPNSSCSSLNPPHTHQPPPHTHQAPPQGHTSPPPSSPPKKPVDREKVCQWILDLQKPESREKAILELSKNQREIPDLAPMLYFSFGTLTVLLHEIVNIYVAINPPTLTSRQSNRVCNTLSLMQCMASHPDTRSQFLETRIPLFLYPFIHTASKTRPFEYLRLTSLAVIGALLKTDDQEVVTFMLTTEIVPLCLRIMESGYELCKIVATFILRKIVANDDGLYYVCKTYDRFSNVTLILGKMVSALAKKPSARLLKYVVECYFRLCDDPRYFFPALCDVACAPHVWIKFRRAVVVLNKDSYTFLAMYVSAPSGLWQNLAGTGYVTSQRSIQTKAREALQESLPVELRDATFNVLRDMGVRDRIGDLIKKLDNPDPELTSYERQMFD